MWAITLLDGHWYWPVAIWAHVNVLYIAVHGWVIISQTPLSTQTVHIIWWPSPLSQKPCECHPALCRHYFRFTSSFQLPSLAILPYPIKTVPEIGETHRNRKPSPESKVSSCLTTKNWRCFAIVYTINHPEPPLIAMHWIPELITINPMKYIYQPLWTTLLTTAIDSWNGAPHGVRLTTRTSWAGWSPPEGEAWWRANWLVVLWCLACLIMASNRGKVTINVTMLISKGCSQPVGNNG